MISKEENLPYCLHYIINCQLSIVNSNYPLSIINYQFQNYDTRYKI